MKSVKRVDNKKGLELAIEDKQTEGWKLLSQSDNQAVMYKRKGGSGLGHFLVLIFSGWWTFLLGNLIYEIICRIVKTDEFLIKVGKI